MGGLSSSKFKPGHLMFLFYRLAAKEMAVVAFKVQTRSPDVFILLVSCQGDGGGAFKVQTRSPGAFVFPIHSGL